MSVISSPNPPTWIMVPIPKVRLPRKQKKRIIKVAGRESYREILRHMKMTYAMFGYHKFNIKEIK